MERGPNQTNPNKIARLSANAIKKRIEDPGSVDGQKLVLQILDHRNVDEGQKKKGLKSR